MSWTKKFKVKPLGRAGILYSEGEYQMTIDSEMLAGEDFDIVVYVDSIARWDPPHQEVVVSQVDVERIRENINEALRRSRIEWQ